MRKLIMLFVTTHILIPFIVQGQSSCVQTNKSCSCEDVLRVLMSDETFYKHLYLGLTDTIYVSQKGLGDITWCKSYTIQGKTITFVSSDTVLLHDQGKITQIWNMACDLQNNKRIVCEIEGQIWNNPDGPEHELSFVILEMMKRGGEYRVKRANCFYVKKRTP